MLLPQACMSLVMGMQKCLLPSQAPPVHVLRFLQGRRCLRLSCIFGSDQQTSGLHGGLTCLAGLHAERWLLG